MQGLRFDQLLEPSAASRILGHELRKDLNAQKWKAPTSPNRMLGQDVRSRIAKETATYTYLVSIYYMFATISTMCTMASLRDNAAASIIGRQMALQET